MKKTKKPKVEYIPIIKKCTYHHKRKDGTCKNCGDTLEYHDGYYLIYTKNGKKSAFIVDTIK